MGNAVSVQYTMLSGDVIEVSIRFTTNIPVHQVECYMRNGCGLFTVKCTQKHTCRYSRVPSMAKVRIEKSETVYCVL